MIVSKITVTEQPEDRLEGKLPRNHAIDVSSNIALVVGENATGKTAFLRLLASSLEYNSYFNEYGISKFAVDKGVQIDVYTEKDWKRLDAAKFMVLTSSIEKLKSEVKKFGKEIEGTQELLYGEPVAENLLTTDSDYHGHGSFFQPTGISAGKKYNYWDRGGYRLKNFIEAGIIDEKVSAGSLMVDGRWTHKDNDFLPNSTCDNPRITSLEDYVMIDTKKTVSVAALRTLKEYYPQFSFEEEDFLNITVNRLYLEALYDGYGEASFLSEHELTKDVPAEMRQNFAEVIYRIRKKQGEEEVTVIERKRLDELREEAKKLLSEDTAKNRYRFFDLGMGKAIEYRTAIGKDAPAPRFYGVHEKPESDEQQAKRFLSFEENSINSISGEVYKKREVSPGQELKAKLQKTVFDEIDQHFRQSDDSLVMVLDEPSIYLSYGNKKWFSDSVAEAAEKYQGRLQFFISTNDARLIENTPGACYIDFNQSTATHCERLDW
jgi:hypothetical protein